MKTIWSHALISCENDTSESFVIVAESKNGEVDIYDNNCVLSGGFIKENCNNIYVEQVGVEYDIYE